MIQKILVLALVTLAIFNVVRWAPGVNRAISGVTVILAILLIFSISG